mmetsp:Transcript_55222/g.165453  ORF Transcript_55222/g.165453 Transcript_55222/m.165453 type:complete len:227 (-) Transcript_55222:1953-2633(-)
MIPRSGRDVSGGDCGLLPATAELIFVGLFVPPSRRGVLAGSAPCWLAAVAVVMMTPRCHGLSVAAHPPIDAVVRRGIGRRPAGRRAVSHRQRVGTAHPSVQGTGSRLERRGLERRGLPPSVLLVLPLGIAAARPGLLPGTPGDDLHGPGGWVVVAVVAVIGLAVLVDRGVAASAATAAAASTDAVPAATAAAHRVDRRACPCPGYIFVLDPSHGVRRRRTASRAKQ